MRQLFTDATDPPFPSLFLSYSPQQCRLKSSGRPANHPGLFISSMPGFVVFSISNVKKVAVMIAIGIVLNDLPDYPPQS